MRCPLPDNRECPDPEACQQAAPCDLVRHHAGVPLVHDQAGHDAITTELVRLTLGGKPPRPELEVS